MNNADKNLEDAVLAALRKDPLVDMAHLQVRVAGGVVSLAGTVSSWAVKMAAQDAARRIAGTAEVQNDIEFRIGDGARLTDADVARAVRQVLPALAAGVRFTVSAGWVTLEGSVPHWKQRGDVEHAIRKLPGVLGVASKIEIGDGVPRKDSLHNPGTQA